MVKPVVIITGADTATGLATVRALQKVQVKRIGVLQDAEAAAACSRYWDSLVTVTGTADRQFSELISLAEAGQFPSKTVLLFSQDSHVLAAWEKQSELLKHFIMPLPERESGALMMDKTRFHQWATDNGIDVPQAFIADDAASLEKVAQMAAFPCILKPLVRTDKWNDAFSSRKFFHLETEQAFDKLIKEVDPFKYSERFILQEWIPGGDSEVFFVLFSFDDQGRCLVRVGGRKLWQWTPLRGSTAVCELSHDTALLEKAEHIAKELGMVGLGSVEFKRDHRSGQFFVTEPTVGRNDYQSDLATIMSVNPTEILVRTCLGLETKNLRTNSAKERRGLWIDELSVYRYIKQEGPLSSAFQLFSWVIRQPRIRCLFFRWSDPRPFFRHFRNTLFGRRKAR